jgi:cholest-4-en-3-one 26-monooxygenase
MSLADVDLANPDSFVACVPHEMFRRLRREAPVYFHPEPAGTGPGFWVLTKHADVKQASKAPEIFSSYRGGTNIPDLPEENLAQVRALMLNMDPPEHRRFRNIVNKAFTPRMVNALLPRVKHMARRIVNGVCEKGECDFVNDVAAHLPMEVICEMMGVPEEDRQGIYELTNQLIGFDDPEFQTSPDQGKMAAISMFVYAAKMAERARRQPGDDLATMLLQAEVDGQKLSELEFNSFFMLLCVAGNETTRTVTSHGMHALIRHPEQMRRVQQDRSILPSAVEEILRYEPAVHYFRRTLTRDFELRGQRLREGDKVTMWYPSANRDEEVFANPDAFDVTRSPNDHLAFGIGEHFCIGANLARMELRVIFDEILMRIPDMRLAAPVRRLRSNFVNGVKEMRVEFTPTKRLRID